MVNFLMTWKGRKSQTSSKGMLGSMASFTSLHLTALWLEDFWGESMNDLA